MKKILKTIFSLSLIMCLFANMFSAFAVENSAIDASILKVIDYYNNVQRTEYQKDSNKKGTLFHMMMRSQTSMVSQSEYIYMVPLLSGRNASEFNTVKDYAEAIIVSVMSGENPRTAVTGVDLVNGLMSMQNNKGMFAHIEEGSETFYISSHIWAMLALDMIGESYDRTKAVNVCSANQLVGGGFSDANEYPDLDTTAVALITLARYKNPEAVKIKNNCLSIIKGSFNRNAEFAPYGEGAEFNVRTHSLCILALTACGIDPQSVEFTVDSRNTVDVLMELQGEDGGFWFSKKYMDNPAGDYKATDDLTTALVTCALLDVKNSRSYIYSIGEVFVDTSYTKDETTPFLVGFDIEYVLVAAGVLVVFLVLIIIIGMFRSGPKKSADKKKTEKGKKEETKER